MTRPLRPAGDALAEITDVRTALARVKEGMCPICPAGPFISVASHVQRIHDIPARQLKDILRVTYNTPLCDGALSARMRERALADTKRQAWLDRARDIKQQMSLAGNLTYSPSQVRMEELRNNLNLGRGRDALAATRRQFVPQVINLWSEGLSLTEIAESTGLSKHSVKTTLRQERVDTSDAWRRGQCHGATAHLDDNR